MRFYLAGPYAQKDKLKQWASRLEALGHDSTASWLTRPESTSDDRAALENAKWARYANPMIQAWARRGKSDILACNTFILDTTTGCSPTGGMMWELAYAMTVSWDRSIVLIGPRANVFLHDRAIKQFRDFETFEARVKGGAR